MALIGCPDCGHQVSDQAVACPECGRPVSSMEIETEPGDQATKDPSASTAAPKPQVKSGPSCIITVGGTFIALCVLICIWGSLTSTPSPTADTGTPTETAGEPASAALPSEPKPSVEIVSVDCRVTESNEVWSKYAWKLKLRNSGGAPAVCSATVEFYDKGGFVVDDDTEYGLSIPPGSEQVFTGYDLVDASVANTIAKVGAKLESN